MNAVEIEAAVSDLAAEEYDVAEFPFQFLAAFDKKETTLKLRKGDSNKSDVDGGVLLQSNIHLAVCPSGETRQTIERLKASPKTTAAKAKFVLATDGIVLEAEDLSTGETIASEYCAFVRRTARSRNMEDIAKSSNASMPCGSISCASNQWKIWRCCGH